MDWLIGLICGLDSARAMWEIIVVNMYAYMQFWVCVYIYEDLKSKSRPLKKVDL